MSASERGSIEPSLLRAQYKHPLYKLNWPQRKTVEHDWPLSARNGRAMGIIQPCGAFNRAEGSFENSPFLISPAINGRGLLNR
jgi:hypothetical protein